MPSVATTKLVNENSYFGDILQAYSGSQLREWYLNKIKEVSDLEKHFSASSNQLTATVTKTYFKVLYCKDEYEVARLLLQDSFHTNVSSHLAPGYRLRYSFGSPWLTLD